MTDLDRFDPFEWLDQIMVVVSPRSARTARSRIPSWAKDIGRAATAAALAAAVFVPAQTANSVALRTTPNETIVANARDPDAADADYWSRVDGMLASYEHTPEIEGEDPELPDYDS